MLKYSTVLLGLTLSVMGCGPVWIYDDGYSTDIYEEETWEVVQDEVYIPIRDGQSLRTQGSLLFEVDVDHIGDYLQTTLTQPSGAVSSYHREIDPCYFTREMQHSLGRQTQILCVDPFVGPYALSVSNPHPFSVTFDVRIRRETYGQSMDSQSLYLQTYTIPAGGAQDIPLILESHGR